MHVEDERQCKSLAEQALLVPERGARDVCVSCGLDYALCPGHVGHIDLALPAYTPVLFAEMLKMLKFGAHAVFGGDGASSNHGFLGDVVALGGGQRRRVSVLGRRACLTCDDDDDDDAKEKNTFLSFKTKDEPLVDARI